MKKIEKEAWVNILHLLFYDLVALSQDAVALESVQRLEFGEIRKACYFTDYLLPYYDKQNQMFMYDLMCSLSMDFLRYDSESFKRQRVQY